MDAAEDAQYGKGRRGDELPAELARRESRLKKIQQAKAELEQEAREKAEQERAEAEAKLAARREEEERAGKKKRGREPRVPDPDQAQPEATAQRNFTDAESRIMPDGANKGSCWFVRNCAVVGGDWGRGRMGRDRGAGEESVTRFGRAGCRSFLGDRR